MNICACFQDWDKPENIPDPDAKKPSDWDEDMDGEWEPPMIPNPEYKVCWKETVMCRACALREIVWLSLFSVAT